MRCSRPPAFQDHRWIGTVRRSGAVCVFIHGFLGKLDSTWGETPHLLNKLLEVDVLELGYPTGVLSGPQIDAVAGTLVTELEDRCRDYDDVFLVGHSMGGIIIQRAVLRELAQGHANQAPIDKIRHIFLFATPLDGNMWLDLVRAFKIPVVKQLKQVGAADELIRETRQGWVQNVYRPEINEGQSAYKRRIDMTIIVGRDDPWVSEAQATSVYSDPSPKVVPGDHTSLKLIADEGDLAFLVLKNVIAPDIGKALGDPIPEDEAAGPRPAMPFWSAARSKEVDPEAAANAVAGWLIAHFGGGSIRVNPGGSEVTVTKFLSSGSRIDVMVQPLPADFRDRFRVFGRMATTRFDPGATTLYVTVASALSDAMAAGAFLRRNLHPFPGTWFVLGFLDAPDHFTDIWETRGEE